MLTYVGIGAVLIGFALAGYRTMVGVKPDVRSPALDESARLQLRGLEGRLRGHVTLLAEKIGERNLSRPAALTAAADYIQRTWSALGYEVRDEVFEVWGERCANLMVEVRGASRPDEIVLVGAHYDTAPGTPGANDNGSGVALLLEMSRALKGVTPARTLRLVAFTNEEPPHFFSERMGSRVHAREARRRGETIVAMLSLETIGYYSNVPGSQSYPPPFSLFYPRTGNFLTVVGNLASRSLVVDFLRYFMEATDFPVEGVATFSWIPGVNWSDHWSFWKEEYPAIMLTDTAPFRYPTYHSPGDVPARIVWPEYARASHGIIAAARRLAGAS
jgi:hypothetical protein